MGEKGNKLNKLILANAWPYNSKKKNWQYPKGKPYGNYKKILNTVFPNREKWNSPSRAGVVANVYAAALLRYSQVDSKIPRTFKKQMEYIQKGDFSKKFSKVGKNVAKGKLQKGDIQVSDTNIRFVVVPNTISKTKDLYIAQSNYKSKYYGRIISKAPAKSSGYTTYRPKENTSTKKEEEVFTAKIFEETDFSGQRGYISQTAELFKKIRDYALKEKQNDLAVTINQLLSGLATESDYTKLISAYYEPLLNECKKLLISLTKKESEEYQALLKTLEELVEANANETLIQAQQNRINSLEDSLIDTSQLEEYIYQLSLCILALQMQKEHEEQHKAFFFTNTFLDDQTKEGGIQYGIIQKYITEEKDYKQLLNENYEYLDYITKTKYTDQFNIYNQELAKVNLKINNLKEVIQTKSKDYFIVQDEIDKINNDIDDINYRLSLFEKENFSDEYAYWNKNVILNPSVLNFWLEFLDTSGELSQFNIGLIGDRPKTVNDTNATSIYFREIPQLIYIAPNETHDSSGFTGYTTVNIDSGLDSLFTLSAQKKSVKDVIDENLYNYAYCAEEINVTAIPIYYLQPGIITSIYDKNSNINGNYVINTISLPLTYNGNMTLTASKMPTRLY